MIHFFDGQKVACGCHVSALEWSVQPSRIECPACLACIAQDPRRPVLAQEATLPVLVGAPAARQGP
jgi:hypothetical protein